MKSFTTLIVGKQGKTGRRVETLLNEAGYSSRGVSRSTTPSFDWNHTQFWRSALQGCQSAYVTFQPDLAVPAAAERIEQFIDTAKLVGIRHIVLLSGRGESGAQACENLLMESGLDWNVLRVSWFAQNFSESFLLDSVLQGQLMLPAMDTLEPFIDVDDIADVAFACLTQADLKNRLFELTGPELLSFRDCASIISRATGKPLNVTSLSIDDFLFGLKQLDMQDEMLWLMNELFSVVFDGRNSSTCDGVEQALGRKARSFSDYAQRCAMQGLWEQTRIDTDDLASEHAARVVQ